MQPLMHRKGQRLARLRAVVHFLARVALVIGFHPTHLTDSRKHWLAVVIPVNFRRHLGKRTNFMHKSQCLHMITGSLRHRIFDKCIADVYVKPFLACQAADVNTCLAPLTFTEVPNLLTYRTFLVS